MPQVASAMRGPRVDQTPVKHRSLIRSAETGGATVHPVHRLLALVALLVAPPAMAD
jgi:hypothetical protein